MNNMPQYARLLLTASQKAKL